MWRARVMVIVMSVVAGPASAQGLAAPNLWARGTELGLLAGGAASSSTTGPMLAGTVNWSVNRWTAIEARGSWFDRGAGASGFGADVGALVNLIAKRSVTPFVGGGFGLYRASFASAASEMPSFYRGRMTPSMVADAMSFTDPAARVTGGVDVIVRRSISIRPEASVLLVAGDGRHETMVTFGVRVGYRFEEHPITP